MEREALQRLWSLSVAPLPADDAQAAELTYRPGPAETERQLTGQLQQLLLEEVDAGSSSITSGDEIGRGGMGVVFRATQHRLEREIALKKLRRDKLGGPRAQQIAELNFVAEALVTGNLQHPNIVPVYDLDRDSGDAWCLAMKLVAGQSWRSLLERPGVGLERHLEILLQVCNAVAYAHSRQVVHCDLKPANVMLGEFGEVLVMDWGLAVRTDEAARGSRFRHRSWITSPCGTPSYMAPELARGDGEALGPWTDIYLLGGLLFHILAGAPPHTGDDFWDVVHAAEQGILAELPASAPAGLRELALRALSADPAARHPSARAFQAELHGFLQHLESLKLSAAADERLRRCAASRAGLGEDARSGLYQEYAEAVAGFRQARLLWQDNPDADRGERRAHLDLSRAALALGDLGMAEAQLAELAALDAGGAAPSDGPAQAVERAVLQAELVEARAVRQREQRQRRRLAGLLVTAVAALIVGLAGGLWLVSDRNNALRRSQDALEASNLELTRAVAFSEQRADVAVEVLDRATFDFQEQLLGEAGDTRASRQARSLLELVRDGWSRLKDTELAHDRSSFGSAGAQAQLGRLLYSLEGDSQRALQDLDQASATYLQLFDDPRWGPRARESLLAVRLDQVRILRQQGELERALQLCDAACRLAQDAGVVLTRARLLDERGDLQRLRGQPEAAGSSFEACLAALDTLPAEDPQAGEAGHLRIHGLLALARLRSDTGALQGALQLAREACAAARTRHARDPDDAAGLRCFASCQRELASLLLLDGQSLEARALLEAVQGVGDELLARDSGRPGHLFAAALEQSALGLSLGQVGASEEALEHLQSARELALQALALRPNDAGIHELAVRSALELGIACQRRGDLAKAEHFLSAAVAENQELATRFDTLASILDQALLPDEAGEVELARGRPAQAAAYLEQAIGLGSQLSASRSDQVWEERWLLIAQIRLSQLHSAQGEPDAARQVAHTALARAQALLARQPADLWTRHECVGLLQQISQLSELQGNDALAEQFGDDAVQMARELVAADPADARFASTLRWVLVERAQQQAALGQYAHAASLFDESVGLLRRELTSQPAPEQQRLMGTVLQALGDCSRDLGESEAALRAWREAGRWLQASCAAGQPAQLRLSEILDAQAGVYWQRGELAAAHELYRQALEAVLDQALDNPALRTRQAWAAAELAKVSAARDELDTAAGLLELALSLEPEQSWLHAASGRLQRQLGNFLGSVRAFSRALELAGDDPQLLCQRGWVQALAGDLAAAREDFRAALPGLANVYTCLWYVGLGGEPECLRAYAAGDGWDAALARFALGELSEAALLELAEAPGAEPGRAQLCEATAYAGLFRELRGDVRGARDLYRGCLATGVLDFAEHAWARDRLPQLDRD